MIRMRGWRTPYKLARLHPVILLAAAHGINMSSYKRMPIKHS
jgi:hypothetical protein